ncbi:unnamed protein product [Tilletia caries]|uniref:Uncharacterized protein n=1 Tax=Tilletia controversa TaxID=13291 RepID=A0A8X7MQQ5_9BASI|nr:hypothetical protein CF335_g7011 [Tilletia laevis]KAE8245522.1 hypothetical protein A4X06_0g5635 [Tilletia controversa]CAD6911770.1 unnamed protein product [Tilletia caries]CAD6948483.1 unnamed protein product [Tilletia controversa]CAD7065887.1 unnamed protein product [Tilletia caries]
MNVPEISDAPETPPPLSGTVSDKDPLFNDVSDEEYSTPPPESNSDVVIKEWHLHTVALMLRSMSPEALVAKLKHTGEYIGGENMSVRLDAATLDERGRFMTPASGTEPAQELRWSYAAKGRSAFGFVNGKTGNAFPPQWANNSTCPSTVELIRSNSHNKSATCERKGYKGASERVTQRTTDHDLLMTLGEDQNLRYNAVPDVTVLDTDLKQYY